MLVVEQPAGQHLMAAIQAVQLLIQTVLFGHGMAQTGFQTQEAAGAVEVEAVLAVAQSLPQLTLTYLVILKVMLTQPQAKSLPMWMVLAWLQSIQTAQLTAANGSTVPTNLINIIRNDVPENATGTPIDIGHRPGASGTRTTYGGKTWESRNGQWVEVTPGGGAGGAGGAGGSITLTPDNLNTTTYNPNLGSQITNLNLTQRNYALISAGVQPGSVAAFMLGIGNSTEDSITDPSRAEHGKGKQTVPTDCKQRQVAVVLVVEQPANQHLMAAIQAVQLLIQTVLFGHGMAQTGFQTQEAAGAVEVEAVLAVAQSLPQLTLTYLVILKVILTHPQAKSLPMWMVLAWLQSIQMAQL